jgi:hypothetical protein
LPHAKIGALMGLNRFQFENMRLISAATFQSETDRSMATKTVLLLGRRGINLDGMRAGISIKYVNLLAATSLDEVCTAFADQFIDVVIIGAGIDLDTRLAIVRYIFETSNATTVHMKDRNSGPAGMLLFVDRVLNGLSV